MTSLGPPGAKPRTNVIGLVGNSAARAAGIAHQQRRQARGTNHPSLHGILPATAFLSGARTGA